jgi:hypothetical protein
MSVYTEFIWKKRGENRVVAWRGLTYSGPKRESVERKEEDEGED